VPRKRKEPTQRTEKGLEIPVPTRESWDDTLAKVIKPSPDRRQEPDDAQQDGDATDEG
jgi:hypothetical protein